MSQSEERIQAFQDKIGLEKEVTRADLVTALEGAIGDRALTVYFIWKALQTLHPDLDADAILAHGIHNYGVYKSQQMGKVNNATDALLNQSSKNGMLVFNQELTQLTDDYAEKKIYNCPLVNAFRSVGCTEDEVARLCHNILIPGDLGMLEPYGDYALSFPKTLVESDVCIMCVRRKKEC